ncbi:unnamed protein product [Vicia faba]|uniref:Uncharacterized protein n=1 Tax=Vicia faba TaxID=3906 RepID=A0AAV1AXQ9_VICFA|nr:unnamed protein product [Vicia faba]
MLPLLCAVNITNTALNLFPILICNTAPPRSSPSGRDSFPRSSLLRLALTRFISRVSIFMFHLQNKPSSKHRIPWIHGSDLYLREIWRFFDSVLLLILIRDLDVLVMIVVEALLLIQVVGDEDKDEMLMMMIEARCRKIDMLVV